MKNLTLTTSNFIKEVQQIKGTKFRVEQMPKGQRSFNTRGEASDAVFAHRTCMLEEAMQVGTKWTLLPSTNSYLISVEGYIISSRPFNFKLRTNVSLTTELGYVCTDGTKTVTTLMLLLAKAFLNYDTNTSTRINVIEGDKCHISNLEVIPSYGNATKVVKHISKSETYKDTYYVEVGEHKSMHSSLEEAVAKLKDVKAITKVNYQMTRRDNTTEWRSLGGFPDYEIAEDGRVISYRTANPTLLATGPNTPFGYTSLNFTGKDGSRFSTFTHEVVAMAYCGHVPRKGFSVDHIDNNPKNNHRTNLRTLSNRENISRGKARFSVGTLPAGISATDNGRFTVTAYLKDYRYSLGTYDTIRESKLVYDQATFNWDYKGILPASK